MHNLICVVTGKCHLHISQLNNSLFITKRINNMKTRYELNTC